MMAVAPAHGTAKAKHNHDDSSEEKSIVKRLRTRVLLISRAKHGLLR